MEDFRFVHESPQSQQGRRKRPRLVTACDNCRVKKIRCVKASATDETCQACTTAKVACQFRDRERYFAERSRLIAGSSVVSSTARRPRTPSYAVRDVHSPYTRPTRLDHSPPPSVYSSHSTSPPHHSSLSSSSAEDDYYDYASRHSSVSPDHHTGSPQSYSSYLQSTPLQYHSHSNSESWSYASDFDPVYNQAQASVPLFEPTQPQVPNYALMPHYVHTFFDHYSHECSFLSNDEVLRQYLDQSLSPILANCIAALAARYSHHPAVSSRGHHIVSEAYSTNAKTLLTPVVNIPSVEFLHALVLIATYEYRSHRVSEYRIYAQMAMRMALDLGISDSNTVSMICASPCEKDKLNATWVAVWNLQLSASEVTLGPSKMVAHPLYHL